MSDSIKLNPEPANMTAVKLGAVTLYFSYQTLVGFNCPHLGTVSNPDGKSYGRTTAGHMTKFGLAGAKTTRTEADFQTLALRAVQGHVRDIGGLLA